ISHLSRIKNPDLLYLSVAAALRAYVLRPAFLDVLASLGTTASLTRICSPCLINCRTLLLTYFLYLNYPLYAISCLTITIYALPLPPKAILAVMGIYLSTAIILSERDILYCPRYVLCLGSISALHRHYRSITRRLAH